LGAVIRTLLGSQTEWKNYPNETRHFCVQPGSEAAVVAKHVIQVELSIKQLMNQTEIDQLNGAIPKLQAFICPAAVVVQNNNTTTKSVEPAIAVPAETGPLTKALGTVLVNDSVTTYFSMSDLHYHIKGLIKNTLPEKRDYNYFVVELQDRHTNASLSDKWISVGPISVNPWWYSPF
jgi:hypothetical protein